MSEFLVCGLGQVGYRIANLLAALGESVTVLTTEIRPAWAAEFQRKGIRIIEGDARDPERLQAAGIRTADAVFAVTSDDSANIEIVLDCRSLRPDIRTIGRIFEPGLARELEQGIGLSRGLAMSLVAAPSIAALAMGDDVIGEFLLGGQPLILQRHRVTDAQPVDSLPGVPIVIRRSGELVDRETANLLPGDEVDLIRRELPASPAAHAPRQSNKPGHQGTGKFIRAVWRGAPRAMKVALLGLFALTVISILVFNLGMKLSPVDSAYFVVTTLSTTGYGDISPKDQPWIYKLMACLLMVGGSGLVTILYSIVTDYLISSRIREWTQTPDLPESGHVLVVGLGNVGMRVQQELRQQRIPVIGIDLEGDRSRQGDLPLVQGDGRDPAVLERAFVHGARAVIAATDNDATNVTIALVAKRLSPRVRTITRIFDGAFARKIQERSIIDVAVSASRIAAPQFVGFGLDERAVMSYVSEDHLVLVREATGDAATISLLSLGIPIPVSVVLRPLSSLE